MAQRKYQFRLIQKTCRGCQTKFEGHSNRQYCSDKCQEKTAEWAKRKDLARISNLEFFLKQKIALASKRGKYEVTITYEDLKTLWDSQKGLCALSGIPMTYLKGSGRVPTNVSMDRIDSSKPYSLDNIQLVCYQVNLMKAELNQDQLIFWAKALINGSKSST